jgi:hypothetical protein
MNANELLDYEIRRTHTDPAVDHDARNRAAVTADRRRARRHRLADRFRSVADRLEA